jgi:hypothetical protein
MGSSTQTTKPAGLFDFLSDERAKENITPIGKTNDGQTIHRYNYKGDPRTQIGLIAQEVEKHHPDAVGLAGGLKTVNYDKATEDSVRAKRYAGGIVNSQGGAVMPMRAGQGFADGGMPMYDPNAMTGLLSSHQGMYAQGLGGNGPVAAPNFAGMGYTPAMPGPKGGVAGGNQAPVDQPHQDNFAEATAKAAVKTAADEQGKKLWDEYAKEPIANAMKPVTNAMKPINSSIDHAMTSMFGPKPIGSEIGNISGPMAGGSEISAAPDLTGLSGAPNPVLNAPQISTPGLAGASGPPTPAMGGPVAPPIAAGTSP